MPQMAQKRLNRSLLRHTVVQFTISKSDLTNLLQSSSTVSTPVTRVILSGDSVNYVLEVNAGQAVGTDKFNNNLLTSTMTVITDKYGNLVTSLYL